MDEQETTQKPPPPTTAVACQVMAIFAATRGYLDGLAASEVTEFAEGLLEDLEASHPEIGRSIRETGAVSDDAEPRLAQACKSFREHFDRRHADAAAGEA